MFSKRLVAAFMAFLVIAGVGSAAFAAQLSAGSESSKDYGNLPSTLLDGGCSADYADGMILFSNPDDNGTLWLRNTGSGSERKITDDNASFINAVGRDIYYISSNVNSFQIVKTNLNSAKEIIAERETEISNLFVSDESIYYLCGDSVVHHKISDGTSSVIFSNPDIEAFVPKEDGIYWLKEKPVQQSHKDRIIETYEGTEEEIINFDCFLYSFQDGTNIPVNYAEVISSNTHNTKSGVSSLALSAEVGGVKIPTEEFPVGSYFTDSGIPCYDHGTGSCGWDSEEDCNCKAFHNGVSLKAIQCYGYARYIYYNCFGEIGLSDSATSSNIGSLGRGEITLESFKALIDKAKPGAHLRVQYIKANGYSVSTHSMVILDSNENGFSVCEANADNKCGVSVRQLSYSSFVPTVVAVSFLMMPDEYPGYTEITTHPHGTPSDAEPTAYPEESTSQADITHRYEVTTSVTLPTDVTVEPTTSGELINPDTVEIILDYLSFFMDIFIDCVNAIIRIVASII